MVFFSNKKKFWHVNKNFESRLLFKIVTTVTGNVPTVTGNVPTVTGNVSDNVSDKKIHISFIFFQTRFKIVTSVTGNVPGNVPTVTGHVSN